MHIYTHLVYIYICTRTCIHVCLYVHAYMLYMYICLCVCTFIYICIYKHVDMYRLSLITVMISA